VTEPTQAPTTAPTTAPTEAPTEPTAEPTVPETEPPLQIQLTPDNTQVLLIHQRAWGFARRDQSKPVEDAIYSYQLTNERLDISVPVTLLVNITNIPKGVEVVSITITFADNEGLAEARTFRLTGSQRSVDIPFLMAGRKYYYQAAVLFSDGTTEVRQTSFRTASTPRLLSVDGIVNVRDIGGWQTTDGYVVRQGLLYRGSELDGAVKPEFCLTAEGLRQMREVLGIRSDLDLRYQDDDLQHISPLGADITYIYYDAPSYTGVFKPNRQNMVRRLFADLADESNYPVYLHCTYGVDRTGTFCYLLEALLGVSEEDLQRDYELSTLYYTWVASKDREDFLAELKTREGNTLQEKTETFLLECGVTPEQIAAIRDIFLEKA
jgi:protein tyrosine/serine phosphatase